MSDAETFKEQPCDHCGEPIESLHNHRNLGDNDVHVGCVDGFVEVTPKMELAPYTCGDCLRSYYTKDGLQHHRERVHA